MGLLGVDLDVLVSIISFLSPKDARSLSRTTRALHPIAQNRALSVVVLDTPTKLFRAHEYLLGDVETRLRCLRVLTVTSRALKPPTRTDDGDADVLRLDAGSARALAELFENVPSLQEVSLECTEVLLQLEPRIWNALTTLTVLAVVEFKDAHAGVLARLRGFRGPLRKLTLHGFVDPNTAESPSTKLSFAGLANAWCAYPQLEHIGLSNVDIVTTDPGQAIFAPCYNVHSLDISHSRGPLPSIIDILPNIRSLSVCYTRGHTDADVDQAEKCFGHLTLVRYRTIYARPVLPWVPTSAVRRLDLANVVETDTKRYWSFPQHYANLVQKTQPLILCLSTCSSTGSEFWTGVVCGGRLRCLNVRLHANWRCHTNMSEWLDKVPTFWKNSNLLYVRIYIGEANFLSRMDIPASLREDTAAAITFVRQTTSERLLTCVPSVRLIAVKLIDETSWWRVQRNGDGEPGRRLVPISRDVGHHVEAYLYSEEFEQTLVLDESRFDHR